MPWFFLWTTNWAAYNGKNNNKNNKLYKAKVEEIYNLEPKQLIEVKGLQGETSDNIPGVPGIGEKTALKLIQEYKNIENLYKLLEEGKAEDVKGKTRERIIENKDLAFLSKELGTININAPIEENLEEFKVEEWDKPKVLKLFKELNLFLLINSVLNILKVASATALS